MQLKKNIVANYFGQGWSVLMGVLFIPLYIKELGAESYGLIGFFSASFCRWCRTMSLLNCVISMYAATISSVSLNVGACAMVHMGKSSNTT